MFHPRPLHAVSVSTAPLSVRSSPERTTAKLCENGRAYVTDPATGQPVCLCQLGSQPSPGPHPPHPAFRGVSSLPASPRPPFAHAADLRSFHSQLGAVSPLSEQNTGLLPPHIAFHPYGAMYTGMDLNGGAMRKAATRETTGPLKAWLGEHKKNPYPTKAEKIMLAIITRMTLTQVSTWFANARRRLKKDNRLANGDGEEESVDSDREGDTDSVSVDVSGEDESDRGTSLIGTVKLSSEGEVESFSDISEDESEVFRNETTKDKTSPALTSSRVPVIMSAGHTSQSNGLMEDREKKKDGDASQVSPKKPETPEKPKPKIWSISHILDS